MTLAHGWSAKHTLQDIEAASRRSRSYRSIAQDLENWYDRHGEPSAAERSTIWDIITNASYNNGWGFRWRLEHLDFNGTTRLLYAYEKITTKVVREVALEVGLTNTRFIEELINISHMDSDAFIEIIETLARADART